jgi:hypothetical protein
MNSTKLIPIFIVLITFAQIAQAQDVVNMLPCDDYEAITFNGKTIEQINATEGDPQQLQQLFGSYSSVDQDGAVLSRTFHYGDNSIHFSYKMGYTNGHIRNLEIVNNQWSVVISGNNIKKGDSKAYLHQHFGTDLIIAETPYFSTDIVSFNCQGNSADGVHIHVNPSTNKIVKIKYWTNP